MAKKIDVNGLDHYHDKVSAMLASEYSSSKTYAVGDYCFHAGTLYECTTAITTAEAWTSGHWTAAKLAEDTSALKTALSSIDTNIYNGYENVPLDWEHGWVNSNGNYDSTSSRFLIKGRSIDTATTVYNGSSSTVYVVYFSSYTSLTNFTYDSFLSVQTNSTYTLDKTKPFFLIESTATTESGLSGIQLMANTQINYLSKANVDNRDNHKQNIFFAYCADMSWTIAENYCDLIVNSDIKVRFDVANASVDTTKQQLLSIAQAASNLVTVTDDVISGMHYAIVFDFGTNSIKIVDTSARSTYVNTAILFYWHYGQIGGVLVNNKTAIDVTNTNATLPTYLETEAQTCKGELIEECGEKSFVIAFTTDNHYGASNGYNFPTTVKTIERVNELYPVDIVVDGGDLINGDETKTNAMKRLTSAVSMLCDIKGNAYTLLGNHDDDSYTVTELPLFSKAELYAMLCRHEGIILNDVGYTEQYGYIDYDQFGLRVIFLDAIYGTNGHVQTDFGYSDAELAWFTNEALNTTNQVVMFSHMAFTSDFIAYEVNVKNGVAMRTAVENFIANGGTVVGLFHGHNHWDYIGQASVTNGFHEVSTGCGRVVSGPDIPYAHPTGATMPERESGTVTQELWDIIVIKPESREVNMIRFGAGDDRSFTY